MPIPRLLPDETALLVIDMQEKLLAPIAEAPRIITNCSIMIRAAAVLGIPVLVTEHHPQALGRTVDAITQVMVDPASRIEKMRFSAHVDLVEETLLRWRRSRLLICGIEAQVCVLQTTLDFQASGRQCFLVSDAIGSSQGDQASHAVRRSEAAGAVTTGVMAAIYELLADADHPSRRACVELVKGIQGP